MSWMSVRVSVLFICLNRLCPAATAALYLQFTQRTVIMFFVGIDIAKYSHEVTVIDEQGNTLAAVFVAEIGDINRFDAPDKLAAFAGIDPSVKQSGEFTGTRCRMSKRGSPYLRRAFWLAAIAGIRSNTALRAIYDKKRSQGKAHAVAVSVVMRKLCNIVYAIMKSGQPYHMDLPD